MIKRITLLIVFFLGTCALTFGQDRTVKGVVRDKQGTGVPGVSIKLKGSNITVLAGPKGVYTIAAPGDGTLVYSSVGFTTQEIAVNNRAQIDVTLADEANDLTEVVVIGYGTAQKKDVTGAHRSKMKTPTVCWISFAETYPGLA
jgi:hypothetical protein